MELKKVENQTTWNVAADTINSNNSKINEAVTRLENATYKNKGYYRTLEDLKQGIPMPSAGSRAFVGTQYPYQIYNSGNGEWVFVGTLNEENIELGNVVTKDDIIVLAQSEFDELKESGALDPYKEYNTYED